MGWAIKSSVLYLDIFYGNLEVTRNLYQCYSQESRFDCAFTMTTDAEFSYLLYESVIIFFSLSQKLDVQTVQYTVATSDRLGFQANNNIILAFGSATDGQDGKYGTLYLYAEDGKDGDVHVGHLGVPKPRLKARSDGIPGRNTDAPEASRKQLENRKQKIL